MSLSKRAPSIELILYLCFDRLFTSVPADAFDGPTMKAFMALYDNYVEDCKVTEDVTPEEEAENDAFLDAILATSVFQQAHAFLVSKSECLFNNLLVSLLFMFAQILPVPTWLSSRSTCAPSGWASTTVVVALRGPPALSTSSLARRTATASPGTTAGSSTTVTSRLAA